MLKRHASNFKRTTFPFSKYPIAFVTFPLTMWQHNQKPQLRIDQSEMMSTGCYNWCVVRVFPTFCIFILNGGVGTFNGFLGKKKKDICSN